VLVQSATTPARHSGAAAMKEVPETHQRGNIQIENTQLILRKDIDLQNADFGIQIAHDGRVWVCINGLAFIRFKPTK
jgi:hypothetical protein